MATTFIIIGCILTNKVVPGAGCRHIYVSQDSADLTAANLTKAHAGRHRDTFYGLGQKRTNIFIIDRFHNSTDIFAPLNCIAEKIIHVSRDFNQHFLLLANFKLIIIFNY